MNKLTKGAIATAAGIALLLGGAGTFALWNGQTTIAGGTTFDPATQTIVPGDVLTLTQQVILSTTGKNLKATFTYDPTSITTDPALAALLTTSLTASPVVAPGSATLTAAGANTYTVTPGTAATTTVNVVFTVTFDQTTSGTVGQNLANALALTSLSYTLTQVRP